MPIGSVRALVESLWELHGGAKFRLKKSKVPIPMTSEPPARSTIAKSPSLSQKAGPRRAELFVLGPDDETSRLIVDNLASNYAVRLLSSMSTIRAALASRGADLLILDSSVAPEADALLLCREFRLISSVAIIILTRSQDHEYRIQALEAGADDCFPRELELREFKARVSSLLRRAAFGAGVLSKASVLRFAGWSLDPHQRVLTDPHGQDIALTAAEFDLLWAFCRNSGKTLSRKTLLTFTNVGFAGPVERSIDVHVSRLRAKIEADPHRPVFLRTVRLGGYVFTPRVEADLSTKVEPSEV
jgi:two-component system, OmpR family, response regulator